MKDFRRNFAIVTAAVSALFAVLLYPAIVDYHGPLKSLFFVALGVAAIWGIFYFWLGSVFTHFYKKGRREAEREKGGPL